MYLDAAGEGQSGPRAPSLGHSMVTRAGSWDSRSCSRRAEPRQALCRAHRGQPTFDTPVTEGGAGGGGSSSQWFFCGPVQTRRNIKASPRGLLHGTAHWKRAALPARRTGTPDCVRVRFWCRNLQARARRRRNKGSFIPSGTGARAPDSSRRIHKRAWAQDPRSGLDPVWSKTLVRARRSWSWTSPGSAELAVVVPLKDTKNFLHFNL